MEKKKVLSMLSVGTLALSLLVPISSNGSLEVQAETTTPEWNVERYGDRVGIDEKLASLAKDEAFLQQAEEGIKQQAAELFGNATNKNTTKGNGKGKNADESTATEGSSSESSFTYDGGTKYFLNRDLEFKTFTLRSIGENVEVWVANDLSFPDSRPTPIVTQEQVDTLRDEFDSNIYPVATEFFGTPDQLDGSRSPLVDWGYFPEGYYETSDKVIMLVDNIKDEGYYDPSYPFFVAGFFWQTIENYMNRNIVTIDTNSWETRLESTFFGTTIHELQHLIHADYDSAEESWINEGLSTFSEFLGGYGHDAGSINFYLDHPENSLVAWDEHYSAETGPETIADYGQAYLFTLYMYDKLGKEFIQDVVKEKTQGITGVNAVLKAYGSSLDFEQLYQNFITAVAIDSSDSDHSGVYDIDSIDLRDLPVDSVGTKRGMTVSYESALTYEKEGVPAWGGDFKELDFDEKIRNISFDGVDFLATPWTSVSDPLGSSDQVLWGGNGDEVDNEIVFKADLSSVNTATLTFDNYIEIEEGWDFGVVQVSTDGGQTWNSLANENTRSDIVAEGYPKIKENVPGFTGYYTDWQKETFDLSAYAGQEVLIAFRYMTDWGYNDAGWYVDDIAIPEIGLEFDGTSIDEFKSFAELSGEYVEYTVTFINEREASSGTKFRTVTVDPFHVTEEDALQLRQLFQNGRNTMITSYAAPVDSKIPVEFTYEVTLKEQGPKE
ncbi:choice-of-anchor J domain-containing protein [Aquibacillus salsiterrae]|uniref:Immune inhibitor A n=1 Tax=Aquibacillus salsiterrae TaxID=2950439 RepID=A0A9X4ADS5_9BACI|nr:choice-of-anchor J domain-containing protein [Aquibacillus salsiterrae]MDC3415882.1 immune inhibitor A [Aquibacillus salsiterrae]